MTIEDLHQWLDECAWRFNFDSATVHRAEALGHARKVLSQPPGRNLCRLFGDARDSNGETRACSLSIARGHGVLARRRRRLQLPHRRHVQAGAALLLVVERGGARVPDHGQTSSSLG